MAWLWVKLGRQVDRLLPVREVVHCIPPSQRPDKPPLQGISKPLLLPRLPAGDEKTLKKNGAIASLTFGAERKFSFKHKKTEDVVSLQLENGSLLMMKDVIQTFWLHRLPPTKKVKTPRINLTFRTIIGQ